MHDDKFSFRASLLALTLHWSQVSTYEFCSPDPCSGGFCDTNTKSCAPPAAEEDDECDEECVNGACDPDSLSCVCDPGYSGADCSEESDNFDYCTLWQCNDHGVCDVDDRNQPRCHCDEGFDGEHCTHKTHQCKPDYVMNIVTKIFDENPNAGIDCHYWVGLNWTSDNYNSVTRMMGFCTCLKYFIETYREWADNMGCDISETVPLKPWDQFYMHCTTCTDDEMDDMKAVLQDTSAECDNFITNREDQPLAWRTPSKCNCMTSLGDRRHASEMIYCPFTLHAARSDMAAYDNCLNPDILICDFANIMETVNEKLKARYPEIVQTCNTAMSTLFEELPGGVTFSDNVVAAWCPCYDAINNYWAAGLSLFDCLPVTFYEFTLHEMFGQYCYDPVMYERDKLWLLYDVVVPTAQLDFGIGMHCFSAVVFAAIAFRHTDGQERAREAVCTCFQGMDKVAMEEHKWWPSLAYHIDSLLVSTVGTSIGDCFGGKTPEWTFPSPYEWAHSEVTVDASYDTVSGWKDMAPKSSNFAVDESREQKTPVDSAASVDFASTSSSTAYTDTTEHKVFIGVIIGLGFITAGLMFYNIYSCVQTRHDLKIDPEPDPGIGERKDPEPEDEPPGQPVNLGV